MPQSAPIEQRLRELPGQTSSLSEVPNSEQGSSIAPEIFRGGRCHCWSRCHNRWSGGVRNRCGRTAGSGPVYRSHFSVGMTELVNTEIVSKSTVFATKPVSGIFLYIKVAALRFCSRTQCPILWVYSTHFLRVLLHFSVMGHELGYARVSTGEQDARLQHDALTNAGCYRIFTDTASGSLESRPQLDKLLDQLRPGRHLGGVAPGPTRPLDQASH